MNQPKYLFGAFAVLIGLLIAVVVFSGDAETETPPSNTGTSTTTDNATTAPTTTDTGSKQSDPIKTAEVPVEPPVKQISTGRGTKHELPAPRREEKIEPKSLLDYYPVGKRIESATDFQISGTGSNKDWGFAGTLNFVYEAVMNLDTVVVSNDGQRIVTDVYIREVSQHRLTSELSIKLAMPDDPLAQMAISTADMAFKKNLYYAVPRMLLTALDVADPNLERSLTWIGQRVKDAGYDPAQVMVASKFEDLSGTQLRVTYLNGWGVEQTEIVQGNGVPEDRLKAYAYYSSQLMDFYIFPEARSRQPGEEWTVDTAKIAGMFLPSTTLEASGEVQLKLVSKSANTASLQIPDGTVTVSDTNDRARAEGRMNITSGTVEYDLDSLFIKRGHVDFQMQSLWESRDHLLFGAEDVRDLTVSARYSARKAAE